jgi:hypothetical protein
LKAVSSDLEEAHLHCYSDRGMMEDMRFFRED